MCLIHQLFYHPFLFCGTPAEHDIILDGTNHNMIASSILDSLKGLFILLRVSTIYENVCIVHLIRTLHYDSNLCNLCVGILRFLDFVI